MPHHIYGAINPQLQQQHQHQLQPQQQTYAYSYAKPLTSSYPSAAYPSSFVSQQQVPGYYYNGSPALAQATSHQQQYYLANSSPLNKYQSTFGHQIGGTPHKLVYAAH